MIAASARLVLFSGLGVGERLLLPQKSIQAARVEIYPWLPWQNGESLSSYSRRIADTIDPAPPLYLGGVSLGGMIALEVAAHLRPRGVFLIAAARSGDAMSWLVKLTLRNVSVMPIALIERMLLFSPLLVRMVGRPDRAQRRFLLDLALTSDPAMTRFGGRAMLDWTAPPLDCPIHHIHGQHDLMIPVKNVSPDVVIPGGGHVINVTHAQQVNHFIESRICG